MKTEASPTEHNIFLSDAPIKSCEADILGRVKFATSLSKNILQYKDKNTIVIGLYGKWGSGKSSIINVLLEDIQKSKDLPEDKKPIIIEFNPWNFSEQENLTSAFFNEIANNLSYIDKSANAKRIAEKLKLYGKFLSTAILISNALRYVIPILLLIVGFLILGMDCIPNLKILARVVSFLFIGFGVLLKFSKTLMTSLNEYIIQWAKVNEKTLKQYKDELNQLISSEGKRLLIVIDDIDRLNTKEIKQIFQLIKQNADFQNTIYLIAFERSIIEKNLAEQKGISGKEYLEKIVQVSFDVPLVQEHKMYTYLFSQLDTIINIVPENKWDKTRWQNLFHAGFKKVFLSLRDVKRYINSLRFNFSLIQQGDCFELNPVDFVGLEAIRVFCPEIYEGMRGQSQLFTNTDQTSERRDAENERKQHVDAIINRTSENLREPARGIIYQLFPQIKGLFGNMHYGSDFQDRWSKELKICSTVFYDRYFILDVPEGEISQYEIEKLLAAAHNKNEFTRLIEEYLKQGKIKRVLDRLEDYVDTFDLDTPLNIVIPLLDISDRLPEEEPGFFDFGSDMHIARIIYHYLKRIEDKAKRSSTLKEAITNSKGLYGCLMKISIELQGIEKKSEYERLINESEVETFKKLCADKIKEFYREGKLNNHPKLAHILYDWIKFGGEQDAKQFVAELISSDEGLVSLVRAFLSRSQSFGADDYVARTKVRISYKSLKEFIDLDEAKKRLEKINTSTLSEKDKLAVESFLKNFDKKDKDPHFGDE